MFFPEDKVNVEVKLFKGIVIIVNCGSFAKCNMIDLAIRRVVVDGSFNMRLIDDCQER